MDMENNQTSTETSVTVATEASNAEPTTETTVTEAPAEGAKPAGFEPVEFTPEQKVRVDHIYGNMKRYENETKELKQINQRLLAALEQVQTEQSKIVNHIQANDFQEAETQLKAQQKAAFERGDLDTFNDINSKLIQINLKKTQNGFRPKQEQVVPQQQYQQPMTATDAVEMAVQRGEMAPEDAHVFKSWISEKDQNGNVLRPWANVGDVRNTAAAIEAKAVFSNPAYDNLSYAQKLAEVDRRMGLKRQQQQVNQNVMGGNLTRGVKNNTIKLSDQQQKIAIKTQFAGPNKSDAEHLEAYRRAVAKSQAAGVRA